MVRSGCGWASLFAKAPLGWAPVEWREVCVWVGMKDGKSNPGLSGSVIKREVSCGSSQTQELGDGFSISGLK